MLDVATRTAEECFIPYTVGGGMRSADDIRAMLKAGADKISLNSAAVRDPELITQTSRIYGAQCIVVAIDARRVPGSSPTRWEVFINGGRINTELDAVRVGRARPSGSAAARSCSRAWTATAPRTATTSTSRARSRARSTSRSSRAGERASSTTSPRSSIEADADAVLAASVFHFGSSRCAQVKEAMAAAGVPVRLVDVD